LQRRCETLIRLVEKENEDLDARDGGKGKPKTAASKGAGGGSSSKGDASRCDALLSLPGYSHGVP